MGGGGYFTAGKYSNDEDINVNKTIVASKNKRKRPTK